MIIFMITGILIGILFDIFRILRKSFKTPDFMTIVEDVIFWILVGGILLFTIFTFNDGEIRNYIFIGLIIGLVIYISTISKYFIKISVKILVTIKNILYFPFKKIYQFCKKFIFQPFLQTMLKANLFFHKKLKNSSKNVENDNFTKKCNKLEQ